MVEFAVESIRQWWKLDGAQPLRSHRRQLICADAEGSNADRLRAYKIHLQRLADQISDTAHRLWLATPHQQVEHGRAPALCAYQPELEGPAVVQQRNDHQVQSCVWECQIKVSNEEELEALWLQRYRFRPGRNYTIASHDCK